MIEIPMTVANADAWRLYQKGEFRGALQIYNQNLSAKKAAKKDNPWFLHDRARALIELGGVNAREAVRDLEQLAHLLPDDPQINVSLAIGYGRVNIYSSCRQHYEKALRLDPNNHEAQIIAPVQTPPDQRAHAIHDKGLGLLQKNNPREALRYYEAAIALVGEAQGAWSLHDKGIALMKLGQYDEAITILNKSKDLLPDTPTIERDIQEAQDRKTAYLARRQQQLYVVEPVMHKQQYAEFRGGKRVDGHKIESCTISSAINALTRMGVIPIDEHKLVDLEEELVRSVLRKGFVGEGGGMNTDVTNRIFYDFGLNSGYARNREEMVAALRAGGCVCPCDGHTRCVTEISTDGRMFKIFDPLFVDSSELWDISRLETAAKVNAIIVYPKGYQPTPSKGETFLNYNYSPGTSLIESTERYSVY